MALNINGTTGISGVDGTVSAPALTGTDSNTGITFPSADTIKFSTGGVERMSISNSGVTGTGVGGKFASYAIIGDQKANDANGGTFTSGAWRTRDLNTEFADADGIVSISSNQFTLQAGTYFVRGHAPAYKSNRHVSKIQNVTDSSLVAMGTAEYNASDEGVQGRSSFSCRFTISGAKTFEIQHRADSTENTYGLGIAHNFGSGFNSIYTIVEIFKES